MDSLAGTGTHLKRRCHRCCLQLLHRLSPLLVPQPRWWRKALAQAQA